MKILKDYLLVVIGTFFIGLGIALTKCAGLGLSTISSVPNVFSIRFPILTLGTWTAISNLVMIASQIIILQRQFKPIEFLQIPLAIINGLFTDFGILIFSHIPADLYVVRLLMTVAGVMVLGFGISITVIANKIMSPAEAIVKAISIKFKCEFANTKILFDVFCVCLAALLSLLFFDLKIVGIREGTVIAMLGTGYIIKIFVKKLKRKDAC